MNTTGKMTLPVFKKKLKDGGYKNAGGARKAVSKSQDLSDDEKNKARGSIDRHFGEAPQPPAKKAKKAKPGPKAKAKPGPKAKAKTRTPSNKADKVAKAKPGPKAGAKRQPKNTATTLESMSAKEIIRSPAAAANLAKSVIGSVSDAVSAMKDAGLGESGEVQKEIEAGVKTLGKAVRLLDQRVVSPLSEESGSNGVPLKGSPEEEKAARILRETRPAALGNTPPES